MLSSQAHNNQGFGRSQLMSPPPTPQKQQKRSMVHEAHGLTIEEHRNNDTAITPVPEVRQAEHLGRIAARKNEGKRLRKAEKNRKKRAEKLARTDLARVEEKRKQQDVQQRDTTPAPPTAQDLTCQGQMTPPLEAAQQHKKEDDLETPSDALSNHDTLSAPATDDVQDESTIEVEDDEIPAIQLDGPHNAMQGYDLIDSSDSDTSSLPSTAHAQLLPHHELGPTTATATIDHHLLLTTQSPKGSISPEPAVISVALDLLHNLSAEQTSLNARTIAVESQIDKLNSTKFKLNHTVIEKLEKEMELTAALSFDLMITEWAFREKLEMHREDWEFDLGDALAEMGREVGECVGGFEMAMDSLIV
ncbi:hypothetical protein NX059_007151 [Plenodomus lindquistii]|nr:hypothetical protein NX059_007151 [Plenodomus lindquistii]